jgi:hypothetical protein
MNAVLYQRATGVSTQEMPSALATTTVNRSYSCTVSRTEMCHHVLLDTDATRLFEYFINPANEALFPWLSHIAHSFDTYSFNYLKFRYVPACGTTTVGQLVMAIDYDPTDNNTGATQADIVAMSGSVQSQLYAQSLCPFRREALPVTTHKFYVSSDDSFATDARLNHVGRLMCYVSADPTVKTVYGSLYVDYSIVFTNPQSVGPGFSNASVVKSTTEGSASTDLFGTVDAAAVTGTKPDPTGSPVKVRRIVKIVEGIATVIAKVAPYVSFVAKLFLLDYAPPFAGVFQNWQGAQIPLAIADIPGDNCFVLESTKCRSGTIMCHAYGTYTTLVAGSRPVMTLAHSTNLTIKYIFQLPTYLCTHYVPATPTLATATAIIEFDYNDLSTDKAWFKPVVLQSGSGDIPAWSVINTTLNVYTKTDV